MAQASRGEWQCCLAEIFREEKYLEFAFEGRKSRKVPDVFGEIVTDVGAKVWKSVKSMGFACVWRRAERTGRNVKVQPLRKIRGGGTCHCASSFVFYYWVYYLVFFSHAKHSSVSVRWERFKKKKKKSFEHSVELLLFLFTPDRQQARS